MADPRAGTIHPALVLAHARAWIGTPHHPRAALRGHGADCVGLLRGLAPELAGVAVELPPWRADPVVRAQLLSEHLPRHLVPVVLTAPRPGDVVTMRLGRERLAHLGVLAEGGRVIHAADYAGRVVCDAWGADRITSAWAMRAPAGCAQGPRDLHPADCVAVIRAVTADPLGPARVTIQAPDGTPLARSAPWPSRAAALTALPACYTVETVE